MVQKKERQNIMALTVTIERVFELTDNDIEYLAKRQGIRTEDVQEDILNGVININDDLHFIATDEYYDYSTLTIKEN
jgi:hypothetical protein